MSDHPTDESTTDRLVETPQRPARRWLKPLGYVLLAVLVVFVALWFGPSPNVPEEPIRMVRDASGRLVPTEEQEAGGGLSFEAQVGTIKARNSFSSTHSSSRSSNPRFACRRVAVFNLSDHLLVERAGGLLLDRLKQLNCIDQLDYYPAGHTTEAGQLAPDITITLALDRIAHRGVVGQDLEADITVTAGRGYVRGNTHYHDGLGPPAVMFSWRGHLEHRSTVLGVSSSAAKYKLAAQNIAEQISDSLTKMFEEYLEKDGPMPELPEMFYPAYRRPPPMPWLDAYAAERVTGYHGLLTRNDSTWRLTTDREPRDLFMDVHKHLTAAGWKGGSNVAEQEAPTHLRMTRDAAVVEVFVKQRRMRSRTLTTTTDAEAPRERTFYVRYLDRMTRDEVGSAVEQAFDAQLPIDLLVLFERSWSKPQQRRALELFEANPPKDARSWLTAARTHQRLKQDDQARRAVLKAKAMLRTVAQGNDLDSELKNLAKKLGDQKLVDRPADPELFRELGFIEVGPLADVPEIEMGVGEPAHFFAVDAKGELRTISIRVTRAAAGNGSTAYCMAYVDSTENSRSWGSGSMGHQTRVDGLCRLNFTIIRSGAPDRFTLTTKVTSWQ